MYPTSVKFPMTLPSGSQLAIQYTFNKDDEIPLHEHDFWHSCCCLTGQCEVFDDAGKTKTINAGQFVEFKAKRKHGIRALVDGTSTVHINEPNDR